MFVHKVLIYHCIIDLPLNGVKLISEYPLTGIQLGAKVHLLHLHLNWPDHLSCLFCLLLLHGGDRHPVVYLLALDVPQLLGRRRLVPELDLFDLA